MTVKASNIFVAAVQTFDSFEIVEGIVNGLR